MSINNLSLLSERKSDLSSEEGRESGSDTASKTSHSSSKHGPHQGEEIAQAETQMLFFSKALVFAVLLLAAGGCAVATYLFTKSGEEQNFEDEVSRTLGIYSSHSFDPYIYILRMKALSIYFCFQSVPHYHR
jgi:hypothetical protein